MTSPFVLSNVELRFVVASRRTAEDRNPSREMVSSLALALDEAVREWALKWPALAAGVSVSVESDDQKMRVG